MGSMYHQTFFIPSFVGLLKENRRGYFETRGGGGHLKLTSDYRGGGMFNGGGGI